jgi:hypothetical protein
MMNNGVVIPQPPVLCALEMVKAQLARVPSVELVDYTPYQHLRRIRIDRNPFPLSHVFY